MSPYFFVYKSIGISWFLVLTVISYVISNFIIKNLGKEYDINKKALEDITITLFITGFVGARLVYILLNIDLYKDNVLSIFKLTHMNLSLVGGVIVGLLAMFIFSKKFKIQFNKLLNIYAIPFYFSISVGIWSLFFDGVLIGKEYNGFLSVFYMGRYRHLAVAYLSLIFLLGMIIESFQINEKTKKLMTYITLILVIVAYYMVKFIFIS